MSEPFVFETRKGSSIGELLDELAALRMEVFREFPYLYEGTKEYEKHYLETYVASPRSFLFALFQGKQMIGATTCLPLADETEEIKAPFLQASLDLDTIFYFGESLLLLPYRGLGFGHRFFDEREKHAGSFGVFDTACFCSVVRPENHPATPHDYRPNDVFWLKRGYQKSPSLHTWLEWPDRGATVSTPKRMDFWTKKLDGKANLM